MTHDPLNAFIAGPRCAIQGQPGGPLDGLTFAVKDLIDIAGVPTGGGNPDWERAHPIPTSHAWIVERLLQAGASVIGKTATDEISLGILVENPHSGTPVNPRAPDRVPGGSSSGSASVVAGGVCDFALGTDTGGSVRVPASFCGLYGIRPTHGRIEFSGITRQAPSSDTVGWFARDGVTFARVGEVVFGASMKRELPTRLIVATDAFSFADENVQQALAPMLARLSQLFGHCREETLAPPGLSVWQWAQRVGQSSEAWASFSPWIDQWNPRLAFAVAAGLVLGSSFSAHERSRAALMRIEAKARMRHLLPPGTVMCLPTTPFPAPKLGLSVSALAHPRDRISCLTSPGGLTGVPQVNLPGAMVDGAPVGLSIIGGYGTDLDLLAVAHAMNSD